MNTVKAQYSFRGSNNDELCFLKDDIITVTQKDVEGHWWEGTLNGRTGWFPSNYVESYKGPLPFTEPIRSPEEIRAFRMVVFKDLLDSEGAHVAEIRGMLENFLEPLAESELLTRDEYTQLMSNFIQIVELHEDFYQSLEESNDRVGNVFLKAAPLMRRMHQIYCTTHPRAIIVVDKYKEELNEFMEYQGAAKPGLLVLTTGLSKPFRRLDKYSAILQELERHMENSHVDRGDTQRSIAVYKEIATTCATIRRQKELELQILTGPIRGWQGPELCTFGDIIHMGSVAINSEHKDRYFVLFPETLLMLSVSQRMSAFKYEGMLPLGGITVNRIEDNEMFKNSFEISGNYIDSIIVICQSPAEANKWVELIGRNIIKEPRSSTNESIKPASKKVPVPRLPQRSQSLNYRLTTNQYPSQRVNQSAVKIVQPPHQQINVKNMPIIKANWHITNLRPIRPTRSPFITRPKTVQRSNSPPSNGEDTLILRIIEAYFAGYQNKAKITTSPVSENEVLTPTMRQLFNSVQILQHDMANIKSQMLEERLMREHLEQLLNGHLESCGKSTC